MWAKRAWIHWVVGMGIEEGAIVEGRESLVEFLQAKESNLCTFSKQSPGKWCYNLPKTPLHKKCLVEDDYTC